MLSAYLVVVLALAAPTATFDTTFAVPRDARIHLESLNGSIEIRAWDRDAVRIEPSRGASSRVDIRTAGSYVHIRGAGPYSRARAASYVVSVPVRAALRITGPFGDVSVGGTEGEIVVDVVQGDVRVRGGSGIIDLRSVHGDVALEDARGRITLATVNSGIRATRVSGSIRAETVNGAIRLDDVDSDDVVASAVNGQISFRGVIHDDGRYSLSTHNGSVVMEIPEGTNANIAVSTVTGAVDFGIPVTLTEVRRGERFNVTLGRGTARIDLESFNGTIQIRRLADRR